MQATEADGIQKERDDARTNPEVLDRPPVDGRAVHADRRRHRRVVDRASADRCRPRHHQQSGADQHGRTGAFPLRGGAAGDVSCRNFARRHRGFGIHPIDQPQRLLAGDGRLRRQRRHLLCPTAGRRAASRGRRGLAARRRVDDGGDLHRPRRGVHVHRRVRVSRREGRSSRGWQGRVAVGRQLSHGGRRTS